MTHEQCLFIAGANGMVGQALVPVLKAAGYQNLLLPSREELDLINQSAVNDFFKQQSIDTVIILAAKVGGIQANIQNPVDYFYMNTMVTSNIIYAALQNDVKSVLNIGSSCMYPKDLPILRESDLLSGILEPTNQGYALAKLGANFFCKYVSDMYDYAYKTLIPCNLYGPYDNFNPATSHMISGVIYKIYHAIQDKTPCVTIWGDGLARREFMYVEDLARCILLALEKGLHTLPDWMNVGLGYDFTVDEYYHKIAATLGYTGDFHYDLKKPIGMKKKCLDVSLAHQWGFKAKYSLEVGLNKTWHYFEKNHLGKEINA